MDNSISAASLNFSGINLSYFEYDDGSQLFKSLTKKYDIIKQAQFPKMTQWKGAYLDKKYKQHRFTVTLGDLFLNRVGDHLPSKQQFNNEWIKAYQEALNKKLLTQNYEAKQEEVEDVIMMDYSFYRALVMHLYNFNSLEQLEKNYQHADVNKLKSSLKEFKNQPRFKLKHKQMLVQNYYQTMDVMFLQQVNIVEWKSCQQYTAYSKKDSTIIFKKSLFGQIDTKQTKKWQNILDFNEDTAAIITRTKERQQGQYLLISSHFASKSSQAKKQAQEMFRALNAYQQYYSHLNQPLKIIIGIDANHFISEQFVAKNQSQKFLKLNIFPNQQNNYTTHKKRSYFQAQLSKANKQVNEVKDHLITTLEIQQKYVSLIDGSQNSNELLPYNEHPFDHYVVVAFLRKL